MQFPPQLQQQRRHQADHDPRPVNLCVTGRTERDHQVKDRLARYPMVNDYGALVPPGSVAHAATVPVTLQNLLPQAGEVFIILPFERVAGCTEAQGENLIVPAGATDRPLNEPRHLYITH